MKFKKAKEAFRESLSNRDNDLYKQQKENIQNEVAQALDDMTAKGAFSTKINVNDKISTKFLLTEVMSDLRDAGWLVRLDSVDGDGKVDYYVFISNEYILRDELAKLRDEIEKIKKPKK